MVPDPEDSIDPLVRVHVLADSYGDVGMYIDRTGDLQAALSYAVALHTPRFKPGVAGDRAVVRTAQALFSFLGGPVVLRLTIGPVFDQVSGLPTGKTVGGPVAQLRDTEQFTLSVDVSDAKGAPVVDQPGIDDDVFWSIDNPDAASLQVSDDSRSCTVVAGNVGSGVVTVALGSLSATLAVDVIPGSAARLTINEGPVETQPGL